MMQCYCKIQIDLIDSCPSFFRKLKRFTGGFRIEGQDMYDAMQGLLKVSFFTDRLQFDEGEDRQVDLTAKRNERGSWYFINIEKR